MKSRPLVSVVIAVKNNAAGIARAIESVLSQRGSSWELIVVDGGSTDGTVGIIESFAPRLAWWLSEPDRGLYDAWNKALPHARGEWLLFIGSDDELSDPDTLAGFARQAPTLRTRIAYGVGKYVGEGGRLVRTWGRPWVREARRFRSGRMRIPHGATFHRRDLFLRGGFNASYRIAGDYEFLLRDLLLGEATFMRGLTVLRGRVGGISDAIANRARSLDEARRALEENGGRVGLAWRIARWRASRLRFRKPN